MSVELHAAFAWDCEECGRENFERAIEGDIDEAALQECEDQVVGFLATNSALEVNDEELESEVLTQLIAIAPKRVKCAHCGSTHETELSGFCEE